MKCEKVDDYGIWGSLPDWPNTFESYLPIGSVTRQRGRGERKEQASFLTRAKRFCAKKQRPLLFVAEVESVDVLSSSRVQTLNHLTGEQICDIVRLTVTRRGVTSQQEASVLETSKRTQRCAAILVDEAAKKAAVPREWARKVALYEPYKRAMRKRYEDQNSLDEDGIQPTKAALYLLLEVIGTLPRDAAEDDILFRLFPDNRDPGIDLEASKKFAAELLALCREEKCRLSRPILHSVQGSIGDQKAVQRMVANGASVDEASNVLSVKSALQIVAVSKPPDGCTPIEVSVTGANIFRFSTKAAKHLSSKAHSFLQGTLEKASTNWLRVVETAESPKNIGNTVDTNPKRFGLDRKTMDLLKPSLNIGVIGDVANGKSTLIRAMSGKRTQAHSLEHQKHGITIRLGFANATILHCRNSEGCGSYSFMPEQDMQESNTNFGCSKCGKQAEIVKLVSFIDCPGHAELMATMLSGASVFDAVIFAAASNTPCPTPQAMQHLEALKLSKDRITHGLLAIAQTKAELLAKKFDQTGSLSTTERLALHASSAKEALECTVAHGAPFFPTCAPLGIGMSSLAEWLAGLSKPVDEISGTTSESSVFHVLRSFDVNHPGVSYDDIVGGVIGGTLVGSGSIRPGDTIEVRPGLVVGMRKTGDDKEDEQKFDARPLVCRCVDVMTEKTKLPMATSGGLLALQTTLCPSLCADNHLVGAVAGLQGHLPPVFGPTLFLVKLKPVNLETRGFDCPKKLLEKGTRVKCHSGSAVVDGHVIRVSIKSGKLQLHLEAPVCAHKGSNVAIEAKLPGHQGYALVALAAIFDGSCCLGGVEKLQEANADIHSPSVHKGHLVIEDDEEDEERRLRFVQELAFVQSSEETVRISVPKAIISKDGGAHLLIENFGAIARSLNRDPYHLQVYLEREAGLSCSKAGIGGASLRVRYRYVQQFAELLTRIIKRYAATFVTCRQCKSAKTEILKASNHSNSLEVLCRQCNARRFIPKI